MENRYMRWGSVVEKAQTAAQVGLMAIALLGGVKPVHAEEWWRKEPAIEQPAIEESEELRFENLDQYMDYVSQYHDSIIDEVTKYDALGSIKSLTPEQRAKDIELYFPMYLAGQISWGVPWEMLWIIHEHETVASRDPNTDNGLFVGGMQRARATGQLAGSREHSIDSVNYAAEGWGFLSQLDQRQVKGRPKGNGVYEQTSDYQEILWAAWNIRSRADNQDFLKESGKLIRRQLTLESPLIDRMRYIVEWKYSDQAHGVKRKDRYDLLSSRGGFRVQTP